MHLRLFFVLIFGSLVLFGQKPASAETRNVVAEGTSEVCFGRERAMSQARLATSNNAYAECSALGSGWRHGIETFSGYSQCERCGKSEEFRCNIKQAVHTCLNMQKEQEEAAAKKRAEQEARKQAEKALAESIKVQAEARRKALLEKTEHDRAENKRLEQQKALNSAREKASRTVGKSSSEVGIDPLARAFSERQVKARAQKPGSGTGDVLGDALASRHGAGDRPKASGDTLDDATQERKSRIAERERQSVLRARTEAAQASCLAAANGVDTCLRNACSSEPKETRCTEEVWKRGTCTSRPGASCLAISEHVCISEGPNPAYEKWQNCTRNARPQCAFPGTVEDCVRQRLQAGK